MAAPPAPVPRLHRANAARLCARHPLTHRCSALPHRTRRAGSNPFSPTQKSTWAKEGHRSANPGAPPIPSRARPAGTRAIATRATRRQWTRGDGRARPHALVRMRFIFRARCIFCAPPDRSTAVQGLLYLAAALPFAVAAQAETHPCRGGKDAATGGRRATSEAPAHVFPGRPRLLRHSVKGTTERRMFACFRASSPCPHAPEAAPCPASPPGSRCAAS
eukprot:364334-Chlamydomonas_euryale.AAC.2